MVQDNIVSSTEQQPADKVGEVTLQPRLYADPQYVFSLFGRGYFSKKSNKWVPSTTPRQTVDIAWAGGYIMSERAKWATEELRRIMPFSTDQELRDFKLREFEAVAAAGTFSHGSAKALLMRSRFIVVDIDDLDSTAEAREIQQTLIKDQNVETALCFVSPKGLGVKWWVELPAWCQGFSFSEQYSALSRYLGFHYGLQADLSCSNVNRLCFLPYDPNCYVNPKYSI